MADAHTFGTLPDRDANSTSYGRTSTLALARRNAGFLVALLYLQDIFWLIVSRVTLTFYEPMYQVSRFEWPIFGAFIVLATMFAGLGMVFTQLMRPLRKIPVSQWVISAVVLIAIGLNILVFTLVPSNARYVSGGLTGSAGIIYGATQATTLASMILLIRAQKQGRTFSKIWLFAFIGSFALTIDGLASSLTISFFAAIIFNIRVLRVGRVIALAALALALAWIGFNLKFSEIPTYLTSEFMTRWMIARFSIQAEQMYTYVVGNSVIGDQISYLDLVFRAISNRFDLIKGQPTMYEYPRSVSEATYFDMMGFFYAGSSPGALLSTAHLSPFFFVAPFVYGFLFMQYFYGISERVSIFQLFAYSFLFKTLHANFSEYLTIISPTLLVVGVFLLACLVSVRNRNCIS